MASKVIRRFEKNDRGKNLGWLQANSERFEDFFSRMDPVLWKESVEVSEDINKRARTKLSKLQHNLGGGAATPVLYFLTRLLRPQIVVETGVAAGYSSQAILSAIDRNQYGTLYSSDFPYFRLENPEQYIGYVVDDHLKHNWKLYIEGDNANLPSIARSIDHIDLFHYDSDKSYAGRKWVMETLSTLLTPNAIVLMDDIQDNSFFRDFVQARSEHEWHVFRYENKYIGMIGNPHRAEG